MCTRARRRKMNIILNYLTMSTMWLHGPWRACLIILCRVRMQDTWDDIVRYRPGMSHWMHWRYTMSCLWWCFTSINNFSVMSERFPVALGWISIKHRIECLAQGHNTVPLASLELTTLGAIYNANMGKCIRFRYISHRRTAMVQVSRRICADSTGQPLLAYMYTKHGCLILYVTVKYFSVMSGRASWVEPVLSKDQCVLLKDTMQWRRRGSNLQPPSSRQALGHCTPFKKHWCS